MVLKFFRCAGKNIRAEAVWIFTVSPGTPAASDSASFGSASRSGHGLRRKSRDQRFQKEPASGKDRRASFRRPDAESFSRKKIFRLPFNERYPHDLREPTFPRKSFAKRLVGNCRRFRSHRPSKTFFFPRFQFHGDPPVFPRGRDPFRLGALDDFRKRDRDRQESARRKARRGSTLQFRRVRGRRLGFLPGKFRFRLDAAFPVRFRSSAAGGRKGNEPQTSCDGIGIGSSGIFFCGTEPGNRVGRK